MPAYYNEVSPHAVGWLRNLISAGLIPAGDVDDRSICDVQPSDLAGYKQCHFFAGLGGWAYAARLAGWPDDRPLWTGSAPCQPFSLAGKGTGTADERHLWPEFFRLISSRKPSVLMGEQVAAAVGRDWLDGVFVDLEGVGYSCGAAVVPACAVDAPHRRDRLWFVADYSSQGRRKQCGEPREQSASRQWRTEPARGCAAGSPWDGVEWLAGADGKSRRVKPGVRLLAHGVPGRVGRLRAYGNAIVPQVAAEVIGAYLDLVS